MTIEELEAALKEDPEKARVFRETLAGVKKDEVASEVEALSLAAAAAGFQITPEEVERARAVSMEVDDSELESVGGGAGCENGQRRGPWDPWGDDPIGHENSCVAAWHCYYVAIHTSEANNNTHCWSDYLCFGDYRTTGSYLCGEVHTKDDNCWLTWEHN